ncbi:hypothetical protein L9F63_027947 [Diploptera punctata]|uniref:Uncharacterized protein n=1 Tax=Diploptera punctata TaxID=6984 RepID=A0AAD8A1L2_DIPPU|nr:hypothetical protein L9F63_027947 [Diploptera punctata]
MLNCWEYKPNSRPSFTDLVEELGDMLDENLRRHFEDMNNPYIDNDEQRMSHNDYLSMMGSPNYRNLMSPSAVDHEGFNSVHLSGSEYQNMKSPTSPASANGSVFEYMGGESNESGYLRMSAKDTIFSPRHTDVNPFKFTPSPTSPNGNKEDAFPKKVVDIANADNYVNVGSSVSNPSYV